jgi:hypothetical protein
MVIAGAESIQRELLGGGAVSFHQQRRHRLLTQLILESVDKIFRWEAQSRARGIAEQIADRVVVLSVSQAADELIRLIAGTQRERNPGATGERK